MSNNKDFKVKNGIKPTVYHEAVGTVVSGSVGYSIAAASYDNKSLSVASQETAPQTIFIGDSNTKFYTLGGNFRTVYQYNATTASDISTASYASKSFVVSTQDTGPTGLSFNSTGTKMYVCGSVTDTIYQYTLTTAWDVSTASYDSVSFSVSSQDTTPTEVTFGDSGTKMYVLGATNDKIFQYSLTTAYDLSTASYASKSFSVANEETDPFGFDFTSDGTKVFVYGIQGDAVFQYSLSTAWDISTASYDTVSLDTSSNETAGRGVAFNSDGSQLYIVGAATDTIYQYSTVLNTATLDLSTGSVFEITPTTDITVSLSNPADSGTVSVATLLLDSVAKTTYDFVNGSLETTAYIAYQSINPTGLHFKPDGTKMYVLTLSEALNEYNLSTAWDIGSAVWYQGAVVNQETGMEDVFFSPDGTKLYAVGSAADSVYEYTLSTAWDISTISYIQSFSVAARHTVPTSIFFNPDGTKMYVMGQFSDSVSAYNLSTAWDISTASYSGQNLSVSSEDLTPEGLFINSDGTKLFMLGSTGDEVNSYNLSTAWDVSTASYNNTFSVATEETSPGGLFFSSDGTKMYVCGQTGDSVYQYNVATYNVITYDTAVKWDGGVAPEGFDSVGTTDVVTFRTRNGGTTYNAALAIDGAA